MLPNNGGEGRMRGAKLRWTKVVIFKRHLLKLGDKYTGFHILLSLLLELFEIPQSWNILKLIFRTCSSKQKGKSENKHFIINFPGDAGW